MAEGGFGNVFFLGVARVDDRVIVASMSYGATVELNGVMKVRAHSLSNAPRVWPHAARVVPHGLRLCQMISPSSITSITAGQHYSYTSGSNTWHLMSVEDLIYMTMTNEMCAAMHAHSCACSHVPCAKGTLRDTLSRSSMSCSAPFLRRPRASMHL